MIDMMETCPDCGEKLERGASFNAHASRHFKADMESRDRQMADNIRRNELVFLLVRESLDHNISVGAVLARYQEAMAVVMEKGAF